MSVARTRHVLLSIAVRSSDHRRMVALAAGALAIAALTLVVRFGGLAGVALLIAVAAVSAASVLWFRLREAERSHAALTLTVADLTNRLGLLSIAAPPVSTTDCPADIASGDGSVPAMGVAANERPAEHDDASASFIGPPAPEPFSLETATSIGLDGSPLRAPAEPKPLQRVSRGEQVSRRGAGGEVSSATALLPLQPEPASDAPESEAALITETETRLNATNDDQAIVVECDTLALPSGSDLATTATTPPSVPESMPAFALTALNGEAVTDDVLTETPAVVVFWRPGCQHCQRLTPELVAWESLQGPRLVVFAACDGPTAFRAGLPGLVILDPGFTVGQALGAPGTPAALPLDAAGRPSGPVVAGASAVTTLLLDAMRDWASVEVEPLPQLPVLGVEPAEDSTSTVEMDTVGITDEVMVVPPTVLLRRVEEIRSEVGEAAPDWDAESVTRRAG